ncbi:carboxypeptidase-like regulatory domain-containing protein [Eggerthella timonensis]|uniref:carboxypeptidase-like regulatory domain-containing protein n=1 Tax=Eggerthella timonensis TaxID=1871008 RepID=UPI0011AEC863|nr:carboxypeptidase-like regulatory domain-containing protein [Eggerthella timonensis]
MGPVTISERRKRPSPSMAARSALAVLLALALAAPVQLSYAADSPAATTAENAEGARAAQDGSSEGAETSQPVESEADSPTPDQPSLNIEGPGESDAPVAESSAQPGTESGSADAMESASTLALGDTEVRLAQSSIDAGVDPENFLPGLAGQTDIRLSVLYRPDPSQSGRWFTVKTPDGFSITTAPTSLESGTIEKSKDSKTLTVKLRDDVSVDVAFDIVVLQNAEAIYDMASAADVVQRFALDSYTNAGGAEPVGSSYLDFKTAKFAPAEYSFAIDNAAKSWGDVSTSSRPMVSYSLTVTKRAYTAHDADFRIAVPRSLVSAEGDVLGMASVTGAEPVTSDSEYYYYRPNTSSGSGYFMFDHAYGKDSSAVLKMEFSLKPLSTGAMFSEELYSSSSDMGFQSSVPDAGATWSFDKKLTLDTSVPAAAQRAFSFSRPWKQEVMAGETGISGTMGLTFTQAYPNIAIKQAEAVIDFPVEVVLKEAASDAYGGAWTYVTNKGNSIKADAVPSLDPNDEWVVQAKYRGPVFGNGNSLPTAWGFAMDVRSVYPDGTAVPDKTVYCNYSLTSLTESVPSSTGNFSLKIAAPKDDLAIRSSVFDVGIGLSSQSIGDLRFLGSGYTKTYEDLKVTIDDPAILGVVDRLTFTSRLKEAVVEYSTNAGTTGTVKASDAGLSNPWGLTVSMKDYVPEGEYLTALSFSFETLDGRNLADSISLNSQAVVPGSLPSAPETDLDGKTVYTSFTWTAPGSNNRTYAFSTRFYKAVDQQILSVEDMSWFTYCPDDYPVSGSGHVNNIPIARIKFAKNADSKRLLYQGMEVDLSGTDPRVLALVSKVRVSGGFLTQSHVVQYTTNLDPAPRLSEPYRDNIDLGLQEGEYLTSLKFVPMNDSKQFDPQSAVTVELLMSDRSWSFVNPDEPFPDEPTSYPVKAMFSAANSTSYDRAGESASFYNKATAKIMGFAASGSTKSSSVYQGDTFTYSGYLSASVEYAGAYKVQSPTYYFKIDKDFAYEAASMRVVGQDAVATTYFTADGDIVLKVEIPDYTFYSQANYSAPLAFEYSFDLRVKPMANPGSGKVPVVQIWADFNASTGAPDEGFVPVVLENTTTDAAGDLGLPVGTPLYMASMSAKQNVLELVEVGASALATADAALGSDVEGHDDSDFGQQLSLVSHVDSATKDWIAYVPVPKAGLSARYQEQEDGNLGVKETAPSDYSQNLTGPVTDAGDDAVVTYCIDDTPSFDLTGGAEGTYVDESAISDWSQVTMIRIAIPEMAAREKRFPVVHYTSDRKAETGDKMAYSGIYYNFKLGDATDWYRGEGAYGAKNSFALVDFLVTGYAWSQEPAAAAAEPAAPEADRSPLAGVSVSTANAVTGAVLSATTGADGKYSLAVPSHGDYALTAQAPSSRYELVEMGAPGDPSASKFDPATGEASVTLSKVDVSHVNAGYSATGPISDPTVLPVTGGPGTVPFALAGLAMMAGAALALHLRRNHLPRRR